MVPKRALVVMFLPFFLANLQGCLAKRQKAHHFMDITCIDVTIQNLGSAEYTSTFFEAHKLPL
jgi:hypothetical protein